MTSRNCHSERLNSVKNLSAVFLCGSLLLAGCRGSPRQQAQKLLQSQHSWEMTARLTTELRQRGAVPEMYARQALDAAKEELDQTRRKREQLSQ
jgi:hypothetical protein